jgi:biotin carboxyl carrier protein
MRYVVTLGSRRLEVDLSSDGRFTVGDRIVAAEVREIVRARQWSVTVEGAPHEVTVVTFDPLRLDVNGSDVRALVVDERALRAGGAAGRASGGRTELRAPMPGLLKAVHVKEGDLIEADAPVATLEAMKMENELRAPGAGRVTRIATSAGTKVEGGALLLVIASE